MYDFEKAAVQNGDTAFGIEGTARIQEKIYALQPEADGFLLNALADNDYILTHSSDENVFYANRAHKSTPDEQWDELLLPHHVAHPLSLIVDLRYTDGHKHSLAEPDIHKTILSSANQRSDLDYYNRDYDSFNEEVRGRMGAFVRHLVDVDHAKWEKFDAQAQWLHAQEYIKALTGWASRNSDYTAREVRTDMHGGTVTVLPTDHFRPRKFGRDQFRMDM